MFYCTTRLLNRNKQKKRSVASSILRTCVVFFWTVNTTGHDSEDHQYNYPTGRRKSGTMFNLYSSMNRRGGEEEPKKEIMTTGHDLFYQRERSRCDS